MKPGVTQYQEVSPREELVSRDPMPKVFTETSLTAGALLPNTTGTCSYQNKPSESSEILSLRIVAPPKVKITIRRTINNQSQEVFPQVYVWDIDGLVDFRKASCKPLTVGRGEYLYIDLVHAYPDDVKFTIVVEKDQLIWLDKVPIR